MTRRELVELRRRVDLPAIVRRRVKLIRAGREWLGLCPFHIERTPSFRVCAEKGVFHCFGCGAAGDAIDFVMRADGLGFGAAVAALRGGWSAVAPSIERPRDRSDAERAARSERARRVWQEARDPRGSLVERYLASRGLALPPAPVLRWLPRCWHRDVRRELPAMVARVDGPDGDLIGIHRTYLRSDGAGKAPLANPKLSLGPIAGGCVRLTGPPEDAPLVVAEGIETALSVIVAAPELTAWAALSTSGLVALRLPPGVREIVIFADCDANGAGERAADRAAAKWASEGRRVRVALPPQGDANDLLMGGQNGRERRRDD